MSVTDHIRRENALIRARVFLLAIADLTDDQRFADHAAVIADILHDHRQANPELAASLARQWAADTLNLLSEIDGTNSRDARTSTASQAPPGVLGSAPRAGAVDQAAGGRDTLPPSSPVRGPYTAYICYPDESGGQA